MPTQYSLALAAYAKPLAHAHRHPARALLGVLLGGIAESDVDRVLVADALPLLHVSSPLAPALEIALRLAEVVAERKSLQMVGVYYAAANSSSREEAVPPLVGKAALKVHEASPWGAVLLVVSLKGYTPESARLTLPRYEHRLEGQGHLALPGTRRRPSPMREMSIEHPPASMRVSLISPSPPFLPFVSILSQLDNANFSPSSVEKPTSTLPFKVRGPTVVFFFPPPRGTVLTFSPLRNSWFSPTHIETGRGLPLATGTVLFLSRFYHLIRSISRV
jgi:hypothetical protein